MDIPRGTRTGRHSDPPESRATILETVSGEVTWLDPAVRTGATEASPAEPEQVVKWYYQNEQQLNEVRSVVLEEQVVDTVLKQAKVTDKQVSYEDAVKPAEAPQAA